MAESGEDRVLQHDATVSDQAAKWFARMSGDRVSEAECSEFWEWRAAAPDHAGAYDRLAATWEATGQHADAPSIVEMRLAALAETSQHNKRWRFVAIAAAIALVVLTTITVTLSGSGGLAIGERNQIADQMAGGAIGGSDNGPGDFRTLENGQDNSRLANLDFRSAYSTRVGEMADFKLPDGSSIALNTASEVRVNFSAKKRDLVLIKGEAVFTVSKDKSRPFIVTSGGNRVVALGTVFAIRRTGEGAKVTLIEGRVRVDGREYANRPISATLVAGEQLRILPDRSFAISKAELSRATSWREGRLVFHETPLREVLEEFNRYTNEKHVLRDDRLGDFLVNGTFRIESSKHFAATLEAGFPVVVHARSGGRILEVTAAQEFEEQRTNSSN